MRGTPAHEPSGHGGTELPRPRRGSHWRWSRPHRALVAGGALAAVLSLGIATGAGAAGTTSGNNKIFFARSSSAFSSRYNEPGCKKEAGNLRKIDRQRTYAFCR